MGSVKLKISKLQKNTPISNIFIDNYMPSAHPTFVTVYILGLRYCYSDKYELTVRNIADILSILESDVIRAWRYWNDIGIIELHEDKESQQFSIEYLEISHDAVYEKSKNVDIQKSIDIQKSKDVQKPSNVQKSNNVRKSNDSEKSNVVQPKNTKVKTSSSTDIVLETRPTYSTQELDFYIKNNEDVRKLFKSAEQYLGKLLSYNDMNLIFSFHDWLRLPIDVIDILFKYCTSNNHRSMRYIEKVAVEWADKKINTVESASLHIKLYNKDFRKIMKSFGISNRDPAPVEVEYMTKWLSSYSFPIEIIVEACKRAILQTGQPSFSYTDGILTSWIKDNVSSLEGISASEEVFRQKKQIESLSTNKNALSKKISRKNRFVNYEQREWNFEELEKLEQCYIDRSLVE